MRKFGYVVISVFLALFAKTAHAAFDIFNLSFLDTPSTATNKLAALKFIGFRSNDDRPFPIDQNMFSSLSSPQSIQMNKMFGSPFLPRVTEIRADGPDSKIFLYFAEPDNKLICIKFNPPKDNEILSKSFAKFGRPQDTSDYIVESSAKSFVKDFSWHDSDSIALLKHVNTTYKGKTMSIESELYIVNKQLLLRVAAKDNLENNKKSGDLQKLMKAF